MTNYTAIANVLQGTFEQRVMTEDELLADEQNRKDAAVKKEEFEKEMAIKNELRQVILDKLGITEEEAKLLLS